MGDRPIEGAWPRHRRGAVAVVAHRGASAAEPENTVAAFAAAARLGADAVELDVRRCASGELVVHHDAALADGRPVSEVPAAGLPSWLPSLGEALDACGSLGINVEIKNLPFEPGHDPSESVAREVAERVVAEDRVEQVLVSSFTPPTLDAVRAAQPAVAVAQLLVGVGPVADVVAFAAGAGYAALNPHHSAVDAALVRAAHDAGLAVCPWTVDEPDQMVALAAMGVDALITNVPEAARRALEH